MPQALVGVPRHIAVALYPSPMMPHDHVGRRPSGCCKRKDVVSEVMKRKHVILRATLRGKHRSRISTEERQGPLCTVTEWLVPIKLRFSYRPKGSLSVHLLSPKGDSWGNLTVSQLSPKRWQWRAWTWQRHTVTPHASSPFIMPCPLFFPGQQAVFWKNVLKFATWIQVSKQI